MIPPFQELRFHRTNWIYASLSLVLLCIQAMHASAQEPLPASGRAYIAYLKAFELAETGSRPAALRSLAESLRLDPKSHPASELAFRLLVEQRANTGVRLLGQTGLFTSTVYSPDGTMILTTASDRTARLWDAHTGAPLAAPLQHADEIVAAAFSKDSKRIATGTDSGAIVIWDTSTGKPLVTSMSLPGAAWSVTFSPDGALLAAASDAGKVRTWRASSGEPLAQDIQYHEAAYHVTFSSDSKLLLIPTGDDYTDLRDASTGARRFKLTSTSTVVSAQFDERQDKIITAGADSRAHLWNAATGQPDGPVFQHGFGITYAAFSADDRLVLTASRDHTARVWNASTGNLVGAPLEHPSPVGRASFSPDSHLVVTAAGDKAIRLWDAATGDPVAPPTFFDAGAYAAFNPNSHSVLLAGGSLASIFDLAPEEDAPAWLADLADFASTLNNYDHSGTTNLSKIDSLKEQLLHSSANDRWTRFGKWYFADITQRPVSPWSELTLEKYVDLLIARGDAASLTYAQTLSHPFPSWLAKVSVAKANLKEPNP